MAKAYANHLIPLQPWELDASAASGLTISQLRFTLSFFLSIPVAIVLRKLPTPKSRHLFSVLSGFLLLYYPFGNGVFHTVVMSALTYLFMLRFRQHCGTLTWLVVFPYLILCHVMSASGLAWKEGAIDFSGAQMVATLKLIAVAMCYQDGLRVAAASKADSDSGTATAQHSQGQQQGGNHHHHEKHAHDSSGSGSSRLKGYSLAKALHRMPSPLEFFSYVFAAGNLLAGPFFEAHDYFDYIDRKGDWDEKDPRKRIPSPLLPGLQRLVKGIVFALVWSKLSATLNPQLMESDWWGSLPVWRRMVMMWVVGFVSRCKYYFAWAVAESGLIFSGLCFEGYAERPNGKLKPRWTRYINSRIRRVEFSTSATELVQNWNICTGIWLRYYVYERLTPPGRRPTFRTVVVTQTVSGIWHGLFPGYWLFFVSSAFMLESSKVLYRYEQGWAPRLRKFPLWTALKVVYSAYTLNYCAAAFQILTFKESFEVWRSVYFSGHILMLAVLMVGAALPPKKRHHGAAAAKPERVLNGTPADAAAAAAGVNLGADGEAAAVGAAAGEPVAGGLGQGQSLKKEE